MNAECSWAAMDLIPSPMQNPEEAMILREDPEPEDPCRPVIDIRKELSRRGLTDRQIEAVIFWASGMTYRQMAPLLLIDPIPAKRLLKRGLKAIGIVYG